MSPTLKLGLNTILLFFPVLITLGFLNILYIRTDSWRLENGLGKFYSIPKTIELANFGNSHVKDAFVYSGVYADHCFNFGLGGGLYNRDFTLLRYYQDRFKAGTVCMFQISYFSFSMPPKLSSLGDRIHYYRLMPYSRVPGGRFDEYIKYRLFPILSAGPNLLKIFNDKVWVAPTNLTHADLEYLARKRYKNAWGSTGPVMDTLAFERSSMIMREIVNYCRESGYIPVLTVIPISRELENLIPLGYKQEFRAKIEWLHQELGQPLLLDYSQDERFIDNPRLFGDSDHMNQMGAMMFTKVVIEDLKKHGLLLSLPNSTIRLK